MLWIDTDIVALSDPFPVLDGLHGGQPSAMLSQVESPLPHAHCRNAHCRCPMPNALRPMPNAQCPTPNAHCPLPIAQCQQVDGRFPEAAPRECGKIYSDDKAQWGASSGTWKLCSGLFLLQPGNASLGFVDAWAERLANKQAGAKNQPHYNAALAQSNLSASVLPCDLFPNGPQVASTRGTRGTRL